MTITNDWDDVIIDGGQYIDTQNSDLSYRLVSAGLPTMDSGLLACSAVASPRLGPSRGRWDIRR